MSTDVVMEDRVIGIFQASTNYSIRVAVTTWNGDEYIDVRKVLPSDKSGETWIYTKAGVRFNRDLVGELMALLEEAKQA
jgi:hypothetical protein